jgi:hypothetical protein
MLQICAALRISLVVGSVKFKLLFLAHPLFSRYKEIHLGLTEGKIGNG